MSFLLIVLAIIGSVCATDDYQDGKSNLNEHIVGGNDTDVAQYPFIVSLRIYGYHFCGGSIYSSTFVITAGHCLTHLEYVKLIRVVAGVTTLKEKGQERAIKSVHVHSKFQPLRDFDIGIVELVEPFVFGDLVLPIALATTRPPAGSQAVALGWGFKNEHITINSDHLQRGFMTVFENDVCAATYGKLRKDIITPFVVCAGSTDGSKDACSNDSGGPLVFENQLVGIVSYGLGCARKGYPGIYSSIADLRDWIIENTKK